MSLVICCKKSSGIENLIFHDQKAANDCYLKLLKDRDVMHLKAGYLTVTVTFPTSTMPYTYRTCRTWKQGEQTTVFTPNGKETVTVISCGLKTRKELERDCPFERYKYIDNIKAVQTC